LAAFEVITEVYSPFWVMVSAIGMLHQASFGIPNEPLKSEIG